MSTVTEAVIAYLSRRERWTHPHGKTDKAGRWYPSDSERQSCCKQVSAPTRSYPWSYMTHCRTIKHVAAQYGVDEKEMKRMLLKKNLPLLMGHNDYTDKYVADKLKEV